MSSVTVIVPVYNVSKYLNRCLDSIVAQTFTQFDVIVVDDGSDDGSEKICDFYAERYAYISVIHQKNQGLSAARNTGIEWALNQSDSSYITFVDSDDWVCADYLKILHEVMEDSGCSISVGAYVQANESYEWPEKMDVSYDVISPETFYLRGSANFIVTWGKLFLKNDFISLRFPLGKIHEDEFTIWKIMLKYNKVAIIDCPIYAYFYRSNSITEATWTTDHLDGLDALEEQKLWIDKHSGLELQILIRKRLAYNCASYIRKMKENHVSKEMIKRYRGKLVGYIKDAKPYLQFGLHHTVYETAWPGITTIIWNFYRIGRKLKKTMSHILKY